MNHPPASPHPPSTSPVMQRLLNWLTPGLGIKRWFLMIFIGITLLAFGFAVVILDLYRKAPDSWWTPALATLALQFLPRWIRAIIFGGIGVGLIVFGFWELNFSVLRPFMRPGAGIADTLRLHRQRERGPRIVAIGGGHGLATTLRGLKEFSNNITAVVTVADDGGSSGRIRQATGILPPGDIRNCLAALSDDEALLTQLFQYRFPAVDGDGNGDSRLEGHSFGNLFITALVEITGSFESAVAESGRVLAVRGRVLPSTLHDVRLVADVSLPQAVSQVRVQGESAIPKSNGKVRHVWLEPSNPSAFPQAIQAILAAELIVIGPGSLYTSILPNLLVPDLADAIRASRALKLFICNVATERGETTGYTAGDHIRVVEDHVSGGIFDIAVANSTYSGEMPTGVDWVRVEADLGEDYRIYKGDLVDTLYPWRHDSRKLAQIVMDLFNERTGPLVE